MNQRREDWAERSARRRNKRLREALPLLAISGDLPTITAEQLREGERRRVARMNHANARMARRAALYRFLVSRRVSSERLAELDRSRDLCPPGVEYAADVFGCELRQMVKADESVKTNKTRLLTVSDRMASSQISDGALLSK